MALATPGSSPRKRGALPLPRKREPVPSAEEIQAPEKEAGENLEAREQKPETPQDRYERQRREENRQILDRAQSIDQRYFTAAGSWPDNLDKKIEKIDLAETLAYGEEIKRELIGEQGFNAITRRTYEGVNGTAVAYVKPRAGDLTYEYDPETDEVYDVRQQWNEDAQRMELVSEVTEDEYTQLSVKEWYKNQDNARRVIALHYEVPIDEIPRQKRMTERLGITEGSLPLREYAASRIDQMLGLDVVPLTVLREEPEQHDIVSVQEAVKTTDPQRPPRVMTPNDFLFVAGRVPGFTENTGPEHPAAKSMMRIAALHWLIKSADAHLGNVIYDQAAQKYYSIDNGVSLGPSFVESEGEEPRSVNPHVSAPLEIVNDFPDWKLDDEAIEGLKRFYEETMQYLKERESAVEENGPISRPDSGIKQLTSLFRLLYQNESAAKKEAMELLKKISYLIHNGRPPILEKADTFESGKLLDGLKTEEEARRKRLEQSTANEGAAA